jgi:hypothetical protein
MSTFTLVVANEWPIRHPLTFRWLGRLVQIAVDVAEAVVEAVTEPVKPMLLLAAPVKVSGDDPKQVTVQKITYFCRKWSKGHNERNQELIDLSSNRTYEKPKKPKVSEGTSSWRVTKSARDAVEGFVRHLRNIGQWLGDYSEFDAETATAVRYIVEPEWEKKVDAAWWAEHGPAFHEAQRAWADDRAAKAKETKAKRQASKMKKAA